ncbi:hypothetical protein [Micromonospora sp. WMMD710]|uniref:hypothetical protein n=1 Tax=Micromonospora sp. WMMD710 TaxID=3016085 RepID=UPI002416A45C|nr:hypothetical protein [Micromonospora sp. WMMD710]MDG4760374.1 hypothetical protein [Micromonospora sp. WMMD710]
MSARALGAVAAGVIAVLVLCAGGIAALFGGGGSASAACYTAVGPDGQPVLPTLAASPPTDGAGSWSGEQLANARTIITVGAGQQVPARGWIIALATAMQESGLRNLTGGDRDSVGLFQQRPSQGWGTPAQLGDPTYAAGKFYDKLAAITGWQTMPLTEAAQAVQRSAYPDAYAKWEDDATSLVQEQVTSSGGVELDCSSMALGTAEPAPRNSDGSWPEENCAIRPDPTTGTGCVTPRLLHLVQQTTSAGFPKPGCYRIDDHGEHPKGRACDWMMTSGGEASGIQKARGDAMAAWAVANADRLGIQYVIWFRQIWTESEGWHPYNNPWGGNDPSGWHTNHIHISVQ